MFRDFTRRQAMSAATVAGISVAATLAVMFVMNKTAVGGTVKKAVS